MKIIGWFFCLVFFLSVAPILLAHEGHDHAPVNMKKAVEIALATARDYTVQQPPFGLQTLDKSWRDLPQSAAQIYENKLGFYVVRIVNPVQDKTLYVRILLDGTVDDANFSGNFESASSSSVGVNH